MILLNVPPRVRSRMADQAHPILAPFVYQLRDTLPVYLRWVQRAFTAGASVTHA